PDPTTSRTAASAEQTRPVQAPGARTPSEQEPGKPAEGARPAQVSDRSTQGPGRGAQGPGRPSQEQGKRPYAPPPPDDDSDADSDSDSDTRPQPRVTADGTPVPQRPGPAERDSTTSKPGAGPREDRPGARPSAKSGQPEPGKPGTPAK